MIVRPADMIVENAEASTDDAYLYHSSDVENPIITVPFELKDAPPGFVTVTEAHINIEAHGPLRNFMTVYYTRDEDPRFTERRVYGRFPINRFEDTQKVFFGDADQLTIVPAGFVGSSFTISSVELIRYAVPVERTSPPTRQCAIERNG